MGLETSGVDGCAVGVMEGLPKIEFPGKSVRDGTANDDVREDGSVVSTCAGDGTNLPR